MGFKKHGDANAAKVFCKCGAEVPSGQKKCPKCGKVLIGNKENEDSEKKDTQ